MVNYKGGEIFIDLGGINIDMISATPNTNIVSVSGIYSRLKTAYTLGKRVVITNYTARYSQNGVPVSVNLYCPTGTVFYIPMLTQSGISMLQILATDRIMVQDLYAYHNIYTPPETSTNSAKFLEEIETETETETEKGEELNDSHTN